MADLRFTLNDGTVLESDPGAPWSMREQVAFEEHFKTPFTAVYQAVDAEYRSKQAADEAGDPDVQAFHFRVTWLLWFGWYRLRPKVAGKFDTFLDQVAGYEFVGADDDGEEADGEPLPDPTQPGESSAPEQSETPSSESAQPAE